MAISKDIKLDEQEMRIRDFLVGAAQLAGQTDGGKAPVLRFAGGWVRDKLLGTGSKDIDVAIDCMSGKDFYHALQIYQKTQSGGSDSAGTSELGRLAEIKKDAEKSKHLETATTKLFGLELDLVNLRTETYDEDSRNPVVEMGTAEEDALRRDATINALFYNLNTQEVEDLTGKGLDDLEAKIIRTPIDPEKTFRDDPLRILRLVRFACRFGFQIEEQALYWMKDKTIQNALEKKISRERILVELEKTLRGPAPARALGIILDQKLYNTIFTVPGYADGVVPRIETQRLEAVLKQQECEDGKATMWAEIVLDLTRLTASEERWRGWLLCALLPWFGQAMPKELIKKGVPATIVARVVRDSLKIDNHTLKVISSVEMHVEEARTIAGQKALQDGQDENSDASRKRQRVELDRVTVGMALRKWGEPWKYTVAAATLLDLTSGTDSAGVMDDYQAFMRFIDREGLSEVWNAKSFVPVLDGKETFAAVEKVRAGVSKGPWMSKAMDIVAEYQLREAAGASKAGAEKAVLDAVEDGRLELSAKSSKK